MHSEVPNMYDGRPTFNGVVYKKTIGNYIVHTDGQALPCELSNRIRKQLIYPTADPGSLHHRVQKVVELEHMDPHGGWGSGALYPGRGWQRADHRAAAAAQQADPPKRSA